MEEKIESTDTLPITSDSLLVGYESSGDSTVLIIGRKRINQSVEIINAFQGEEATEIYKKLIEIKKGD